MKSAKFAHALGLGILLGLPAGALSAQSSGQSTPDHLTAPANRDQDTKKDQSKSARVWANDTIPKRGHEISVVGSNDAVADGANPAVAPDGTVVAYPVGAVGADAA